MKSSLRSTLQCSIIYVVGNLSMSGPNLQFCYLISNLDRARFRPVVVVTSGDEVETAICRKLISLDVEIVYFNVGKVKSLLVGGSRLADICYRMGPAVIHPYGFRSDMLAFFSRHVPRLGSVRNNLRYNYQRTFGLFLGYLISKINLIFLHKTENVISCGTSVQNNLRTLGLESIAIRNSIDIDIYRQMFCSSKVGSTSTRSEKKYLTVASALPGKNVEFLVEQFSRFQAGSRTLIVIGKAAKELLAEFGDHPNIDFRGQVAMPGDALLEADYFISASEHEGLPNAVLEAIALEKPVILSDIPAHREIFNVASKIIGELFSLNKDSLIERITSLEKRDYEYLSRNCVDVTKNKFSAKLMTKKYEELYSGLVK